MKRLFLASALMLAIFGARAMDAPVVDVAGKVNEVMNPHTGAIEDLIEAAKKAINDLKKKLAASETTCFEKTRNLEAKADAADALKVENESLKDELNRLKEKIKDSTEAVNTARTEIEALVTVPNP